LNRYPRLKKILHSNELKGYENIEVEFKHGVTPTAYFYGESGAELAQQTLGNADLKELKSILSSHGFQLRRQRMESISSTPTNTLKIGTKYYEFFEARNYFQVAKDFAESRTHNGEKGRLLVLQCAFQENSIRDWLNGNKVSAPGVFRVWLGASDSETEGNWRWLSGPLDVFWSSSSTDAKKYSNWRQGEPNDAGGENCATLLVALSGWNDVDCEAETASIVVEYGTEALECLDQNADYL